MNPYSRWLVVALFAAAGVTIAAAENAAPLSLFSDRRAQYPGDLLTVLVSEVASVSANAQTRPAKERVRQREPAAAGRRSSSSPRRASTASSRAAVRSNAAARLLARLSVRIDAIDANGNFLVSGEQLIVINNEKQKIRVSGIVRPDDVTGDNTVPSWRVSGANIELVGKGILARKQSPGILTRLLSLFGQ